MIKKCMIICIIATLIICSVGCGPQVTEAPTTSESSSESPPTTQPATTTQQPSSDNLATADIKDGTSLYDFINNTYPNKYTREDFDQWTPTYLDITEDGREDVVFTTEYFQGKLEQMIIVSSDNGSFRIIPSDIGLAKYANSVECKDGFLIHHAKSGGSGLQESYIFLYRYDGVMMKDIHLSLEIDTNYGDGSSVSMHNVGTIEGPYTNFVYTLIENNLLTNKTRLLTKCRYTYEPSNNSFNVETLQASEDISSSTSDSKPQQPTTQQTSIQTNQTDNVSNDYKQGYTAEIVDGKLYVTYTNTGNKVLVYDADSSTVTDNDGDGFNSYEASIYSSYAVKTYNTGYPHKLYFTGNETSSIEDLNYNRTMYVDMADLKVYVIGDGVLEARLEQDPFKNWSILCNKYGYYSIYNSDNKYMCKLDYLDRELPLQIAATISELEESNKGLEGFTSETIDGGYIDYTLYKAVVIPEHETMNKSKLKHVPVSFGDNTTHSHGFSLMGKMEGISITYKEYMDSEEIIKTIDSLENSYVEISVPAGSDFSFIRVNGFVKVNGDILKEVSFIFNDMSEEGQDIYLFTGE